MHPIRSTIIVLSISASVLLITLICLLIPKNDNYSRLQSNTIEKLENLHTKLKIKYGTFQEELVEQTMAVDYITENRKVLELGGNIGRNSLVIASILKDSTNLVVLESDDGIAKQLEENRNLNNLSFHIEPSALSIRKLIQKGWDTIPSETLQDGYKWVQTISLENLRNKYNVLYDTLVIDCEGAFYYILKDMPDILNNITLIVMENDYRDMEHKIYVDSVLTQNNFQRVYVQKGGFEPCYEMFWEVWSK